jgi:hypothetical protein
MARRRSRKVTKRRRSRRRRSRGTKQRGGAGSTALPYGDSYPVTARLGDDVDAVPTVMSRRAYFDTIDAGEEEPAYTGGT